MEYRPANISDARKLSILFKQVYIHTYGREGVSDEFANFITGQFSVERLERVIAEQPESLIVAANNGNLVGVAEVRFGRTSPVGAVTAPELSKLYILDWFCGRGIGERLLQESEKLALSRGTRCMWLWVLTTNTRAVSFYEKHGYVTIGSAPFQMEVNSYDNFVMLKEFS